LLKIYLLYFVFWQSINYMPQKYKKLCGFVQFFATKMLTEQINNYFCGVLKMPLK